MREITTTWRRSSFCADGNCVEVASVGDGVALRDSKNVNQPPMRFTREEWSGFLGKVTAQFDGR